MIGFCYVQNENGDQSFRTGTKPQIELKNSEKIFIQIGGGQALFFYFIGIHAGAN